MLVLRAEVWPHGSYQAAQEIGRIGIARTSTRGPFSSYEAAVIDTQGRQAHTTLAVHLRSDGWLALSSRIVNQLWVNTTTAPGGAPILSGPTDPDSHTIAALLRDTSTALHPPAHEMGRP